jgi:hypothetical protein
MHYKFIPPTESKKYIDPMASVDISKMFEAYNNEVRQKEKLMEETHNSMKEMDVEEMKKQTNDAYHEEVATESESEDESEADDEQVNEMKKTIKLYEQTLVLVWNALGDESFIHERKAIEQAISHIIEEAVGSDEEVEPMDIETTEVMKTPRKCRRCSEEYGTLVPLRGHKCPFRMTG